MRNWLIVLVFTVVSLAGKGQVLTFQDTVRTTITTADTADVVINFPLTNPSTTDTIKINWKRTVNDFDANWLGTEICDLHTCYPSATSSGPSVSAFPPNSTNNFVIHFLSNRKVGTGHVQLAIYTPGHDSLATLKYTDIYLTVNNTTGINSPKMINEGETVKVYPNPAKDFILIQNKENAPVSRVEVYSMLGRKVLSEKLDSDEALTKIDLSEMQKGIYMVRVFDEMNNVVVTKSISHIR